MTAINPYLNFDDNTEEVFDFYKSVFGGDFLMVMRFKEMPAEAMDENHQMPEREGEKIMHIALPIGQGSILMGSDRPASMGSVTNGNNVSISLDTDSHEEATRLFEGLSAGGQVTMPLNKAFWGGYFGMFIDKYGVQWMVSYDDSQQN